MGIKCILQDQTGKGNLFIKNGGTFSIPESWGEGPWTLEIDEEISTKTDIYSLFGNGAGSHNSIYRGKYLGDYVTEEQYEAIEDGTFKDLFIGDYWTINNINWKIAAFDYYYQNNINNHDFAKHNISIIPSTVLYTANLHSSEDASDVGYMKCELRISGLEQAKDIIKNAFGENHIFNRRSWLSSKIDLNSPWGIADAGWVDTQIEIMNSFQVFGHKFRDSDRGEFDATTEDCYQFPIFILNPSELNGQDFWLRDIYSNKIFIVHQSNNMQYYRRIMTENGVLPAFAIKA